MRKPLIVVTGVDRWPAEGEARLKELMAREKVCVVGLATMPEAVSAMLSFDVDLTERGAVSRAS